MVLERWKKLGRVEVSRDERGRFVSWRRIVRQFIGKRIAVYGHARVDGKVSSRRIEFYGRGRELRLAVVLALDNPPKRPFITVSAKEFNRNLSKYSGRGRWVGKPEVES